MKIIEVENNKYEIIKDYKNAEIANCENVDKSAVTRSLKVGIEKIFKKYKKF